MPHTAENGDWLTLSEASQLLGVHPATLRLWSDEGKVRIFRTPGGHRRFARADIERMLRVTPLRGDGLTAFVQTEALQRTRREIPTALRQSWAQGFDEESRKHWREAGRQMITLASRLIVRKELPAEERAEVMRLGAEYGRLMASTGHSLPDAVMAFIFFRDFLIETIFSLPETTGLDRDAMLSILQRTNDLLNDALRAMMDAHAAAQP
jgi:excisionase family DNA binding protein